MSWRGLIGAALVVLLGVVAASFGYGVVLLAREGLPSAEGVAVQPSAPPTIDVDALLARARTHLEKGEVEQAILGFRWVVASSASADALLGLAEGERRAGREDVAAREYQRVLRVDARNATALRELAGIESHHKEAWRSAEDRYRAYLQIAPEDAEAALALARLLAWQGKGEAAIELFARHDVSTRLQPEDRRDLAFALVKAGRPEQAQPVLEALLADRPGDDDLRLQLAGIHAARGDWPAALRDYGAVLERRPDDAEVNRLYGQGLLAEGRPAEALAPLQKALNAAPASAETRLAYARALRETGRPKDAAGEFGRVTS